MNTEKQVNGSNLWEGSGVTAAQWSSKPPGMGSNPMAPAKDYFFVALQRGVTVNMWEVLNNLSSMIVPILAVILTYVGVKEHIKKRKAENYWKQREEDIKAEEMRNQLNSVELKSQFQEGFSILYKELEKYTKRTAHEKDVSELWSKLEAIKNCLEDLKENQRKDALRSLSRDIVKFAESLRKGEKKSRHSFENVADFYKRYKELGGNNYIDEEWNYIREVFHNEKN